MPETTKETRLQNKNDKIFMFHDFCSKYKFANFFNQISHVTRM